MYDKEKNQPPMILFGDAPNLKELCAITVHLNMQVMQQASTIQPQILKCREIIFTEPNVIATPSLEVKNAFHIVMQQSLYKTGRLHARFQKIGLECGKPMIVTSAMYQSCLRYTLLARIAPKWNKAGDWLIQGRDFLTTYGYSFGVKMDLMVNHEEIFLSLEASAVRFQPLQVDDLDIVGNCYQSFMNKTRVRIDQNAIGAPWCHVLPSMKKGQVVCISHELPNDGPFKSYKDLKRHWKNTYGYRLPESEEGIVYYQVHFRPLGGRVFTYPEFCLRARDLQKVPRVDPKPVLATFFQDIQSKLSNVCGKTLTLQSKVMFTSMGLSQCVINQTQSHCNLSAKPTDGKVMYRSQAEMVQLLSVPSTKPTYSSDTKTDNSQSVRSIISSQEGNQYTHGDLFDNSINRNHATDSQKQMSGNQSSESDKSKKSNTPSQQLAAMMRKSQTPKLSSFCPNQCSLDRGYSQNSIVSGKTFASAEGPPAKSPGSRTENAIMPSNNHSSGSGRIVPSFSVRKKAISHGTVTQDISSNKTVPVFKPRKMETAKPCKINTANTERTSATKMIKEKTQNPVNAGLRTETTNPSIRSNVPKNQNSLAITSSMASPRTTTHALLSDNSNVHKTFLSPSFEDQSPNQYNVQTGPQFTKPAALLDSKAKLTKPNKLSLKKPSTPIMQSSASTPSPCSTTSSLSTVISKDTNKGSLSLNGPVTPNTPTGSSNKRMNQIEESSPKAKKPRAKPQIQDVDIESLALSNMLHKANTITLVSWLKQRGITCKTKDKKPDIINKIREALHIVSEQ